ncbi:hypothetical protein EDD85DRAFT_791651 [Armillaria nabsnona]|nr:hypothetical protein EDD85DRAFT_791651 [Armillaria nabsnona]
MLLESFVASPGLMIIPRPPGKPCSTNSAAHHFDGKRASSCPAVMMYGSAVRTYDRNDTLVKVIKDAGCRAISRFVEDDQFFALALFFKWCTDGIEKRRMSNIKAARSSVQPKKPVRGSIETKARRVQDDDPGSVYIQGLKGFYGAPVWLERGVIYEQDDDDGTARGFPKRVRLAVKHEEVKVATANRLPKDMPSNKQGSVQS